MNRVQTITIKRSAGRIGFARRAAFETRVSTRGKTRWRQIMPLVLMLGAFIHSTWPALANSMTQKDVQILAKAIGFLEPSPSGPQTVAIVYDAAAPGSKQDADSIAGFFGSGLKAGSAMLNPKPTEVSGLMAGGFIAVIVAAGVKPDKVLSATRALHVACITGDSSAIQAGQCVMSVKSDPKVEILISHAAATASGIGFGSAFLMMAHEI